MAAGREYRTLVCEPIIPKENYFRGAIRSDSRLLAMGMSDGVRLWNLARGGQLAFLPVGQTGSVLFEPSGELLTFGDAGLLRWPLRADPASTGHLRLGPPQKLPVPAAFAQAAHSQDGKVIASAQFNRGGLVLHADLPDHPIPLRPHADVRCIAVSPDGQWAVTGSHNGTGVKVWEARTGTLVTELMPEQSHSSVGFSPDGRWLATSGGGCRLWAVGTWREGLQIGGVAFAFSPDSKVLAVETGRGMIRLVDPETTREYARLEDPHQDRAGWIGFSPDGTQLVATNGESQSIHVWDLRAIRRQLADIGLDWNQPPYPPPAVSREAIPLQVTVDLGELAKGAAKENAR